MAQVPDAFTVCDEWDGRVATITIHGEIDTTTADSLRECLSHVIGKDPDRLIIDLAQVAFLDSSAVHAFVQARHRLAGRCPVTLRSPQRQARRLFELTGLDSLCIIE